MELILIAVTMAVVMLIGVNWLVARKRRPTAGTAVFCLALGGVPWMCLVLSVPLLAQGFLLALTLPLVYIPRRGVMIYRIVSVSLALAVWGLVSTHAFREWNKYASWQKQTAFESMADRIPEPKSNGPDREIGRFFEQIESHLQETGLYGQNREWSLRILHDSYQMAFLTSSGFGVTRMSALPQSEHFSPVLVPIIPQGDEYAPNVASLGAITAEKPGVFERLHGKSILSFVNPEGFGYVKSRTEVAGFRPHHFNGFPAVEERWSVSRIDLVGLLKQESPVVYVSDRLPRMDQLVNAPTRKLDAFETEGLAAIRKGNDLFVRGDDKDVRMVGAIRSVEQCVKCHGGKRGDLLGAFSYRVMRLEDVK